MCVYRLPACSQRSCIGSGRKHMALLSRPQVCRWTYLLSGKSRFLVYCVDFASHISGFYSRVPCCNTLACN